MKSRRRRILIGLAAVIGSLFFVQATCDPSQYRNIAHAIQSDCGAYSVDLSSWWPNGNTAVIDPVSGVLFIYWIDTAGNVSHGLPGGKAYYGAFEIDVGDTAIPALLMNNVSTSEAQLRSFQKISFSAGMLPDTGLRFVQFVPAVWRDRSTGKLQGNSFTWFYSVPFIVNTSKPFCVVPVASAHCNGTERLVPPLGPVATPNPCPKAFPATMEVLADSDTGFCLKNRPHGYDVMK